MATFILNASIIVEGDAIETEADAISEVEIMLNDYEDMNPYCNSIIIKFNKKDDEKMNTEVKWLVDDDYHELTEKGRFILGSAGIGYNGYYIPYSDLLKLPKEDKL